MATTYGSKLMERLPRVADIVSFRFNRPDAYRFQAGQWFVVTFPSADPEEPWEHHFSHSDSPTQPWLEFTTRMRSTDFKKALGGLRVGSPVQVEGPFGAFVLPPDIERAAFLTGGIGITCVRSILRWLCDACTPEATKVAGAAGPANRSEVAVKEIVLFFANRSEDAIPFAGEIEEYGAKLSGFRAVHVLSRPGDDWQGYRGHLDQKILERELTDMGGWHFFVSGPPSFTLALQKTLKEWGVADPDVTAEQFPGY